MFQWCFLLIISDIEMPGMSGLQMIEMTQNCIPNSKFIFISAYERFAYAHQALKFKACDYLIKPFTQSELRRAVDEALAELKKYEYFPETESNYTPLMKSVLEYLENAAYSSVTLEMAAEHFNMSSSKLGRMIKKETDMRYADLVMLDSHSAIIWQGKVHPILQKSLPLRVQQILCWAAGNGPFRPLWKC